VDFSFRFMPLEGEGGECIASEEDCPNTKDGIDKFYRHWSQANNVSGKMKIVTKLSLTQLKLHTGTFLSYLRRRGVHLNYAQLGVFDTVTLGWAAGAHPSYSYYDEMKERMSKLMTGEHKNVQYALFPRSFHNITD
jgi:homoserine trans-succinylase